MLETWLSTVETDGATRLTPMAWRGPFGILGHGSSERALHQRFGLPPVVTEWPQAEDLELASPGCGCCLAWNKWWSDERTALHREKRRRQVGGGSKKDSKECRRPFPRFIIASAVSSAILTGAAHRITPITVYAPRPRQEHCFTLRMDGPKRFQNDFGRGRRFGHSRFRCPCSTE